MRWVDNKYRIEVSSFNGGQKQLIANDVNSVSYTLLPYNRLQKNDFSWSPDSKKIAYLSNKDGHPNIWLVNADGSNDFQLTNNQNKEINLSCPLWSADGKQIFYTSKNEAPDAEGKRVIIWQIEIEAKNPKQLTQPGKFLRLLGWGQNGNEILFAAIEGASSVGLQPEVTLHRLNVKTGAAQQIAMLKEVYLYNINLSPDGKTIAFVAHRNDKDDVWLLGANGGEEKKLTANNDSRLYFSSMAWSPDNNSIFYGKQSRYSLLSMLTNFK